MPKDDFVVETVVEKICKEILQRIKNDSSIKKKYGMNEEDIDWNLLDCIDVSRKYCIYIKGVGPNAENFKNYLMNELLKYGLGVFGIEVIIDND